MPKTPRFEGTRLLKRDLFGSVERGVWTPLNAAPIDAVRRDTSAARWWTRSIARRLLRRERRALEALRGLSGTPSLLHATQQELVRTWISGSPLQLAGPPSLAWHADARRLISRVHRRGIVHNDLAKEPNLLVTESGGAGLVDFQLATVSRRRSRLFRSMAREDLRHLLKHKRTYHREHLRPRERSILSKRGMIAALWLYGAKPIYHFITRRIFGWRDREGAGDRSV